MARKRAKFIILDEIRRIELEIRQAENLIAGVNMNKRINEIKLEKLKKELQESQDIEKLH